MKPTQYLNLLLIAFSIFIFSCNADKTGTKNATTASEAVKKPPMISAVWKVIEFTPKGKKGTKLKKRYASNMKGKGEEIFLYPDYKLVRFEGDKDIFGTWSFDETKKELLLKYKAETDTFKNVEFSRRIEMLYFSAKLENAGNIRLVQVTPMASEYNKMPYYPNNLLWKTKPTKPETEKEIKQRVLNFVAHYAYLFKAATDDELKNSIVSFKRSRGIIKTYQRRVGIVKKADIPEEWYSYFYSKEQAMLGYNYYKEQLRGNEQIKTGASKSWMRDNFTILGRLYDEIAKDIEKSK